MSAQEALAEALFCAITGRAEPIEDGSELDAAIGEDAARYADAAIDALRAAGWSVVKLKQAAWLKYGDWKLSLVDRDNPEWHQLDVDDPHLSPLYLVTEGKPA